MQSKRVVRAQILPLPCEGREVVSSRPSTKVKKIRECPKGKYNSEGNAVMNVIVAKMMEKRTISTTSNTITEIKESSKTKE